MTTITAKAQTLTNLAWAARKGQDTEAARSAAVEAHGQDSALVLMASRGDLNVAGRYLRKAEHAACNLC